jgi:hypothetical protein
VKVVTVKGWVVPKLLAKVTDHIVFLDSHIRLRVAQVMLERNANLTIHAFMIIIDKKSLKDKYFALDWSRIRAVHIIMPGDRSNVKEYERYYRDLRQAGDNVYQTLELGVDYAWHAGNGMRNFVVMDPEFVWSDVMGQLPLGTVGFELGALNAGREEWTATCLKELEHGGSKVEQRLSKRDRQFATHGARDPLKDPLKDSLRAALSGGVQNPLTRQPYHRYSSDILHPFDFQWLRFLQKNYPQFCTFDERMFVYTSKPLDNFAYFFPHMRLTSNAAGSDDTCLYVDDRLLRSLKGCPAARRFMVGVMHIVTYDDHHANAVIIDTDKRTLTRFDPCGCWPTHYDGRDLDDKFSAFVRDRSEFGIVSYLPPDKFCPVFGPQSKADFKTYHDFEDEHVLRKDRGWCVPISLMFIHHRLAHPEKSDFQVEQMMSGKGAGQLAMDIRTYTNAIVRNADPSVRQDSLYLYSIISTTSTPKGDDVQVIMNMNDNYPRTTFLRCASSLGSPECLIRMTGRASHNVLVVSELRTKMEEIEPRARIKQSDSDIIDDAELIMFFHVFETLPAIDILKIEISHGFEWEIAAISKEGQGRTPHHQSAAKKRVDMESIRRRAHYYAQQLGFEVGFNGALCVVTTTRQNIVARYMKSHYFELDMRLRLDPDDAFETEDETEVESETEDETEIESEESAEV